MIEKFKYTQDPLADEPIMFIDTHVGFDDEDGQGVSGSEFMRELFELDGMGKKRICIHINSGGGNVTEGMSIYHAILNSKTPVDTYCVGIAASIAAVIFQAGKNRIMADYGTLMFHNPYNPKDTQSKGLDAIRQAIIIMVASRSGMSENEVETMMNKTTFLDAEESKMFGLCDTVVDSGRVNKKRVLNNDVKAMWRESAEIVNKYRNINKTKNMNKIANKLGLVAEANEDTILKAIDSIVNKNNEEIEGLKNEVAESKAALEAKELECKAMEEKAMKLESELNAVNEVENAKKAEEMEKCVEKEITDAVNAGKIKSDDAVKLKWKNMFKADFEGTKEILNSIEAVKAPVAGSKNRVGFNFKAAEVKAENKAAEIEGLKNMGIKYGSMEYYNYMKRQEKAK